MTSETCFVVKMKQTRQAQGLQNDFYRLIIMINEYILVLNTMSSYGFFCCCFGRNLRLSFNQLLYWI